MSTFRLISWNVNGIRAVLKKGFWEIVENDLKPDILCLQETKADDSIMASGVLEKDGYDLAWHSCQLRKGYSGVATLSKIPAQEKKAGLGLASFDPEGRVVVSDFGHFVLLNVYFPNGGKGPHRVEYKLKFYAACLDYCEKLRRSGKKIIITGDFNTAHQEIDLHDPKNNHKTTGFMPEERAWLDKLVTHGYHDTFRVLHPEQANIYTWWDLRTRSRDKNKGWRIDYFFASEELLPNIQEAFILPEVQGSDHCPVGLLVKF